MIDRPAPVSVSRATHIAQLYQQAVAYHQRGMLREAETYYKKALKADPDHPASLHNLGAIRVQQGRAEDAAKLLRKSLAAAPDSAEAHSNLGRALQQLSRPSEAIPHYERALALKPGFAEAHNNYGNALLDLGRIEEARAQFEAGVALDPHNFFAHCNLVLCLNYLAEMTPEAVFAAHQAWGKHHAATPLPPEHRPASGDSRKRRIRIGYVSADFRIHSVAFYLAPLLAAHDRERFEIVCFSDVAQPDAMTARFAAGADSWVDINGLGDAAVTGRIRAAAIDILVDLAGHTARNRLGVFARKPAPVQIAWLGYPNTTGLAAIDYRITDAIADPPGDADRLHTERLLRLSRCFLCYGPPAQAGPVTAPPATTAGRITFGSFNNIAKVTPPVIALWSRVLQAVPESRLFLKAHALRGAEARTRALARFAERGIGGDRIHIADWTKTTEDHLALYGEIDIALDTFPYNGTTTTCEALWMGVPVVTLAGDRHAARVGASLLTAAGLPEFVTAEADAFVAAATGLAQDRAALAVLRAGLREKMRASDLCDAAGFARAIETAFRKAWETWCEATTGEAAERSPGLPA